MMMTVYFLFWHLRMRGVQLVSQHVMTKIKWLPCNVMFRVYHFVLVCKVKCYFFIILLFSWIYELNVGDTYIDIVYSIVLAYCVQHSTAIRLPIALFVWAILCYTPCNAFSCKTLTYFNPLKPKKDPATFKNSHHTSNKTPHNNYKDQLINAVYTNSQCMLFVRILWNRQIAALHGQTADLLIVTSDGMYRYH